MGTIRDFLGAKNKTTNPVANPTLQTRKHRAPYPVATSIRLHDYYSLHLIAPVVVLVFADSPATVPP